ncbi:FKBP-type peptidyl-prolyl cis-trans isomerase SlyD (EC 5.2.1.8) [uncultured Gammaproteobacteria bacterium]|jgi:FKBP-type peptidyl-prolyl cis-trans isomerase SlyD|nr:FKBP-type peptidyl-prolyl cis-trans isomerase SlyD (EC 5.2.1.8) [uncultured Gammaproteobacteria bacterium]CAC9541325.1 FKBP-type peptidyl-prolyl cis-trans isomerase SlyD (EC 5.2.1.8) [uncultured Gammaproteobacteria bacterium]CAC9551507.1 FKBP-type peptidyl-prolyl cis-trans isomerase SlyD (EC 5.2.1.8) [uncultured Gammaproteobacteria bacterium]
MSKMVIEDGKFVELTYKVIDKKTKEVLSEVEFPLGYIQGISEVLSSEVTAELVGQEQGDVIELPINCDEIYGPRDESLVFIDHLDNVPKEYRKIGMTVTMENEAGEPKDFIVTRVDENSVTVDGNNPMCGREVVFILQVITVREPTDEEATVGGPIEDTPVFDMPNARKIH